MLPDEKLREYLADMNDPHPAVGQHAVRRLIQSEDPRAIGPFVEAIARTSVDERSELEAALVDLLSTTGDEGRATMTACGGLPRLVELLKQSQSRSLAQAIALLGDASAIAQLLPLVDEPGELGQSAWEAVANLAEDGSPEVREAISRMSVEAEPRLQVRLASLIGRFDEKEAADRLRGLATDDDPELRRAAIGSMGSLSLVLSADPIREALKDENREVRWQAAWGFRFHGSRGKSASPADARDTSPSELASRLVTAARETRAREADPAIRTLLLEGLVESGEATDAELRESLASESLVRNQFRALSALVAHGSAQAIDVIGPMLMWSDFSLVSDAVEALVSLDGPAASRWLAKALNERSWGTGKASDDMLRDGLIQGLGRIGGEEAIPTLLDEARFFRGPGPIPFAPADGALIGLVERLGRSCGPALLEATRARSGEGLKLGLRALSRVREPGALDLMMTAARSPDGGTRTAAAESLAELAETGSIGALVELAEVGGRGSEYGPASRGLTAILSRDPGAVPGPLLQRILQLPEALADSDAGDIAMDPVPVAYEEAKRLAAAELTRRGKP